MKTLSMEIQDLRNEGDADMLGMVQVAVDISHNGTRYLICLQNDNDRILTIARASGDQSKELADALCVDFFDLKDHAEFSPNLIAAQEMFDEYIAI